MLRTSNEPQIPQGTPRIKNGFDIFDIKSVQPINRDLPDNTRSCYKNDLTNPSELWNREMENKPKQESIGQQIQSIKNFQKDLYERQTQQERQILAIQE